MDHPVRPNVLELSVDQLSTAVARALGTAQLPYATSLSEAWAIMGWVRASPDGTRRRLMGNLRAIATLPFKRRGMSLEHVLLEYNNGSEFAADLCRAFLVTHANEVIDRVR